MESKKERKNKKSTAEYIANAASNTKMVFSSLGAAQKGCGQAPNPIIKQMGKGLGVVNKAIHDPQGNIVEKIVCGTAGVLTETVVGAGIYVNSALQGARFMPPHPLAKAAGGVIGMQTVAPMISTATKPYGYLAQKSCHAAINYVFPSKPNQIQSAIKTVNEKQTRNKAINTYQPNQISWIGNQQPYSFNKPYQFNNPYSSKPNYQQSKPSSFQIRSEVNKVLKDKGYRNGLDSLSPTEQWRLVSQVEQLCSFSNHAMSTGYSSLINQGGFRSTLSMTGLMSSYNSYNISSAVREAVASSGVIGGVASQVSIITDLVDSTSHANANEYFFCFRASSVSTLKDDLINQIAYELHEAYFKHKTLPFFSLHFNNKGFLYPVIHPAYENTLIGEVIAFLDYWMKGYLNGGVFDLDFLKKWHETTDCNEDFLRENLIDLKKYCKAQANGLDYISLRELESRYGQSPSNSAYNQPYMTSFRIIAYQDHIKRHENILIPAPTFKVEYSIDLMPDYKEYLEQYLQEHGTYPQDYQNIRHCYEQFAEEIKEKMPQLPFCQEFFQLLGVINTYCYAYATFEKMGKRPVIEVPLQSIHAVPNAFPPIPVRYFKTYPIQLTINHLFDLLQTDTALETLDADIFAFLTDSQVQKLSESFKLTIKKLLSLHLRNQLTNFLEPQSIIEINEEEIERLCIIIEGFFHAQSRQIRVLKHKQLDSLLDFSTQMDKQCIMKLPLLAKIQQIEQEFITNKETIIHKWDATPSFCIEDVLPVMPEELHQQIRELFTSIDLQINEELAQLILTKKENNGAMLQKAIQEYKEEQTQRLIEKFEKLDKEAQEIIDKQMNECRIIIEEKNTQEYNQIQAEIDELQVICQALQGHINTGQQSIAQLQTNKNNQVAAIPAHLHAINAPQINAFVAGEDNKIASIQNTINEIQGQITLCDADTARCQFYIQGLSAKKESALTATLNAITQDIQEKVKLSRDEIKEEQDKFNNENIESVTKATQDDLASDIAELQLKTKQTKIKIFKEKATACLEIVHADNLNRLSTISQSLKQASQLIQKNPEVLKKFLSEHYTHAFIGFTGNDLAQKTGDNFQIIGGCGLSLPNIKTIALDNGAEFSQALEEALTQKESGSVTFTFNNETYKTLSLFVADVKLCLNENPSQTQQEARENLFDLMLQETQVSALPADTTLNASLDKYGAGFMHYSATALDAKTFEQLPSPSQWSDTFGNTPLHFAAQSGNAEVIPLLISRNPNLLEAKNNEGATALFLSIQYGELECVKALIDLHADVNVQLPNGLFPLYVALQNNYEAIAVYLLEHAQGLAINVEIDSKMTALHIAIDSKAFTAATYLLKKDAITTIKRKADGFTALHCLIKSGNLELLQLIKAQGLDLTSTLESGKTLLHVAAESGQLDTLKELIAYGLCVNAKTTDGNTALMLAIKAGHLALGEVLAECVEVNAVNNQKESASLLAIQYDMPCIGDILLARGESPQLMDNKGNDYGYYLLRNGEDERFFAAIKSQQLDINRLYNGKNALELALQYGQFALVYDLVNSGLTTTKSVLEYAVIADEINYVRDNFESHLTGKLACLSAQHGSIKCLTWFLKQLSTEEASSLLKTSLEGMHPQAIELVLDRVQDINAILDTQGNTALHLALMSGSREVLELLMSRGCDIKVRNKTNQTAFHIALLQEDNYLLKRLFKLSHKHSNEWPEDLWTIKTTSALTKVLERYQAYSLKTNQLKPQSSQQDKAILPEIILDEDLKFGLKKLKRLFKEANYEEATNLLEEYPHWHILFKSQQGAGLLLKLFVNLYDCSALMDSEKKEKYKEQLEYVSPNKLLTVLKRIGINPTLYTGLNNILLAIIKYKEHDVADYRLSVIAKHFPESLVALAMDEMEPGQRMIELALKYNKVWLFESLEALCRENNSTLFALHEAVIANNYELVQKMLNHYPANSINLKRHTPLMLAAASNHVKIMELLITHGANPEKRDIHGQTALHHALHHKAQSAALTLLSLLVHKNLPCRYGKTPLMLAASAGLLPIVRYLCAQGNFADSFDKKGFNALHYAAISGQTETVRYLVQEGYCVDVIESPRSGKKLASNLKRTPLHLAALNGQAATVNALIELNACIEKQDSRCDSFFEYAVKSKNTEMIELVSQHPSYLLPLRQTQLLLAAASANQDAVVSELILNDVNLNAADKIGVTALHKAAINNSGEVAMLLLSGGDLVLDATDQVGFTPLHYAAYYGHVWLIELLADAGANLNAMNKKQQTPLFLACQQGHAGAVTALLKQNADFNLPNKKGLTPGQIALAKEHLHCAKQLHAAGDTSLYSQSLVHLSFEARVKMKCTLDAVLNLPPVSIVIRQGLFRVAPINNQESRVEGQLTC